MKINSRLILITFCETRPHGACAWIARGESGSRVAGLKPSKLPVSLLVCLKQPIVDVFRSAQRFTLFSEINVNKIKM